MIKFKRKKTLHIHKPVDPQAIALLRAHYLVAPNPNGILHWRCECGQMVTEILP